MRGPSTVLFLAATVLLACLPGAQPQLAQLGRVWTPVDVDKNVHLQQISTYIKAMNDRNIFSSTAVPTNILSVAETSEPQVLLARLPLSAACFTFGVFLLCVCVCACVRVCVCACVDEKGESLQCRWVGQGGKGGGGGGGGGTGFV
jgi:hypothetical protein